MITVKRFSFNLEEQCSIYTILEAEQYAQALYAYYYRLKDTDLY